jgi:hypothetical protein
VGSRILPIDKNKKAPARGHTVMGAAHQMACITPGEAIEATGLVMPVRLAEAALALENMIPGLVNSSEIGSCRAVMAITDRFESCGCEEILVESVPEAGGPIMPLEGEETTAAILDSWVAKGTVLGADGEYSVFVVFLDVMRRPLQGSWTVQNLTVLGTRQSVPSLIEELEIEKVYACM